MGFFKTPDEEMRELGKTWTGSKWDFSEFYVRKYTEGERGTFGSRIYVTNFVDSYRPAKSKVKPDIDLENYVILEGEKYGDYAYPDLLVAKQKSHFKKKWRQTQEDLQREGFMMLTLRQFIDFINLLESGEVYNGREERLPHQEIKDLLDGIVGERKPWRGEWLDCSFEENQQSLYINYEHQLVGSELIPQITELVWGCILKDQQVDLFGSNNKWGLPTHRADRGVTYHSPVQDGVVRFVATAEGPILSCSDRQIADRLLGARPVRKLYK